MTRTVLFQKLIRTPWISKARRKSSKQKQNVKFLKSKNPEDKLIYKNQKNFFEKLRKKFKQNYYSNLLEKHKDNAKQRWQVLKEITGKIQKKKQSLPSTLETKNGIISDKNATAEEFNTFLGIYVQIWLKNTTCK